MPPSASMTSEVARTVRPKTKRRHGACDPCRVSRVKCDGLWPCGSCKREKKKVRTCEYNDKAKNIREAERLKAEADGARGLQSISIDLDPDTAARLPLPPYRDGDLESNGSSPSLQQRAEIVPMQKRLGLCFVVEEFLKVKNVKGSKSRTCEDAINNLATARPTKRTDIALSMANPMDWTTKESSSSGWTTYESQLSEQVSHARAMIKVGDLKQASARVAAGIRLVDVHESDIPQASFMQSPSPTLLELCEELVDLEFTLSILLGTRPSISPDSLRASSELFRVLQDNTKANDEWYTTRHKLYDRIYSLMTSNFGTQEGIVDFLTFAHRVRDSDPTDTIYKAATCTVSSDPWSAHEIKFWANLVLVIIYCRCASISTYCSGDDAIIPLSQEEIITTMQLQLPRQRGNECKLVNKHAIFVLEAFHRLCEMDAEKLARAGHFIYGAVIAAVLIGTTKLKDKNSDQKDSTDAIIIFEADIKMLKDINRDSTFFDKALTSMLILDEQLPSTAATSRLVASKGSRRTSLSPEHSSQRVIPSPNIAANGAPQSRKRSIAQVDGYVTRSSSRDRRMSPAIKPWPYTGQELLARGIHPPVLIDCIQSQMMLGMPSQANEVNTTGMYSQAGPVFPQGEGAYDPYDKYETIVNASNTHPPEWPPPPEGKDLRPNVMQPQETVAAPTRSPRNGEMLRAMNYQIVPTTAYPNHLEQQRSVANLDGGLVFFNETAKNYETNNNGTTPEAINSGPRRMSLQPVPTPIPSYNNASYPTGALVDDPAAMPVHSYNNTPYPTSAHVDNSASNFYTDPSGQYQQAFDTQSYNMMSGYPQQQQSFAYNIAPVMGAGILDHGPSYIYPPLMFPH